MRKKVENEEKSRKKKEKELKCLQKTKNKNTKDVTMYLLMSPSIMNIIICILLVIQDCLTCTRLHLLNILLLVTNYSGSYHTHDLFYSFLVASLLTFVIIKSNCVPWHWKVSNILCMHENWRSQAMKERHWNGSLASLPNSVTTKSLKTKYPRGPGFSMQLWRDIQSVGRPEDKFGCQPLNAEVGCVGTQASNMTGYCKTRCNKFHLFMQQIVWVIAC